MKKEILFLTLCLLAVASFSQEQKGGLGANENETTVTKTTVVTVTKKETSSVSYNPLYNMGRGIANIGTCALEIPRCMIYDNAMVPLVGLVWGVPEGAIYTVGRAVGGVFDIISFGFDGRGIYSESFPEFIWNSSWLLPEEETVVTEKTVVIEEK